MTLEPPKVNGYTSTLDLVALKNHGKDEAQRHAAAAELERRRRRTHERTAEPHEGAA